MCIDFDTYGRVYMRVSVCGFYGSFGLDFIYVNNIQYNFSYVIIMVINIGKQ
jgi:hypothetical protein